MVLIAFLTSNIALTAKTTFIAPGMMKQMRTCCFIQKASLLRQARKKEIDLDLYCAVERFQFDKVEELLKQGANPRAEIYDGLNDGDVPFDSWSAIDRIDGEVGFLCCETMDFVRQLLSKQSHWFIGEMLFQNLMSLAAHSEMSELLKKYEKTE